MVSALDRSLLVPPGATTACVHVGSDSQLGQHTSIYALPNLDVQQAVVIELRSGPPVPRKNAPSNERSGRRRSEAHSFLPSPPSFRREGGIEHPWPAAPPILHFRMPDRPVRPLARGPIYCGDRALPSSALVAPWSIPSHRTQITEADSGVEGSSRRDTTAPCTRHDSDAVD